MGPVSVHIVLLQLQNIWYVHNFSLSNPDETERATRCNCYEFTTIKANACKLEFDYQ